MKKLSTSLGLSFAFINTAAAIGGTVIGSISYWMNHISKEQTIESASYGLLLLVFSSLGAIVFTNKLLGHFGFLPKFATRLSILSFLLSGASLLGLSGVLLGVYEVTHNTQGDAICMGHVWWMAISIACAMPLSLFLSSSLLWWKRPAAMRDIFELEQV